MEAEWIVRLVVFGIAHWVMVALLLPDLARREKVFGGRKWFWAVVIIFVACFGSLLYLLFHPQIFNFGQDSKHSSRKGRK